MNGDDQLLVKLAIFGVTMSVVSTLFIGLILTDDGDYSYDQISGYRQDLIGFSGESMLSNTPWVLTDVMTPWVPPPWVRTAISKTDGFMANRWTTPI